MLFHKAHITDDVEIRLPIYDDEIFTICPQCGKKVEVDHDSLIAILQNGDFSGTQVYCEICTLKVRQERKQTQIKKEDISND